MRLARTSLLFAACLMGTACDIPTELPIIQQRWVLPVDDVSLDQAELLPSSVSIVGDQYAVSVADGVSSETVGNLCSACAAVNGITGPAPAFSGTFSSVENLPTDVIGADVASGSVDLQINNQLGWDPIAGGGSLSITLRGASGGPLLATLLLDNLNDPTDLLPDGVTTMRTISLGAGLIDDGIEATISIESPGGQITTMDTSNSITVTAVTSSMRVWGATVDIDGLTAELTEEALEVEDLDDSSLDGLVSGTVILDVTNPFGLVYTGEVVVGPVTKSVVISAAATSEVEIGFTGDELRSFLGVAGVTLSGSGMISGGPATVTPSDTLTIDPSLDLVVELGGS